MAAVDIDANRQRLGQELGATGRQGIEGLVEFLDRYGFFEAECAGVEAGRGGAVNHSLWTLYLARRERERFRKAHPEIDIPEESLTLVCLLHDVCDCAYPAINGRNGALRGGHRSEAILRKAGAPLTDDELAIIRSHTFNTLGAKADDYSVNVRLVHYLLYQTCRKACDYASGIPFGTEPVSVRKPARKGAAIEVWFEPDDHRTWWNTGGVAMEPDAECGIDSGKLIQMTVGHLFSASTDAAQGDDDIAVLTDDYGSKAILTTYSRNDGDSIMYSDRACFDYRNMVLLISHYPHYRASYVVAQRLNGKWGAFSVKRSGQGRTPLVRREKVLDYDYHTFEEALAAIAGAGRRNYKIRVTDADFYTRVALTDIIGKRK